MSTILMAGDPRSFLNNFAAFGLAAILEEGLQRAARVATASPNALKVTVDGSGVTQLEMAEVVKRHAERHLDSWVSHVHDHAGRLSGTMSPRLAQLKDPADWRILQAARWAALDSAFAPDFSPLDLLFMGALGEPAYWYINDRGQNEPDRGASGWEMKTRNRGEEFVQNRLAELCRRVAARSASEVLAGLAGEQRRDEAGKDSPTSRTPTGLSAPGPVDNALAWCALWGISLFPVAHSVISTPGSGNGSGRQSVTAGLVRGLPRPEPLARAFAYVPLFERPTRLARVRSIIASGPLARAAARRALEQTQLQWSERDREKWTPLLRTLSALQDDDRLSRQGCTAILLGYLKVSDNPNAPEAHVTQGHIHVLRRAPPQ